MPDRKNFSGFIPAAIHAIYLQLLILHRFYHTGFQLPHWERMGMAMWDETHTS